MSRRFGVLVVLLVVGAWLAVGCDRRPRLVPAGADSLVTLSRDSLAILARNVQDRWESGDEPEEAARLSAVLVLSDLARRNPVEWGFRTRTFLDSLAIGAELASAPCVQAINFFSRANPEGGSWPYLIWCGETRPRMQALDARGLHLLAVGIATTTAPTEPAAAGTPPAAGAAPVTSSSVALLYTHRSAGGQQPLVTVWSHAHKDDPWNLLQTLGADSLGGVGSAELAERDTALELVTRTYQVTRGFDECPTCPHVYRTRRFHLTPGGFMRIDEAITPSPYATFVMFITALLADDRDAVSHLVANSDISDQARHLGWQQGGGTWRVAPETDEAATSMVFMHGRDQAFRVNFAAREDDWVISGIEPTSSAIE
ncbi:MAG: hypothetical protein ACRENS_10650 [Candidatus Eiseniibacteriota bacterium]